MWTQMHGDEATATKAIFDLVNWLNQDQNEDQFLDLTIMIIPMLNPDGAEKYQRENKLGINLNRDAKKKVSKEARLLWHQFKEFRPGLALNLHDQKDHYNVVETNSPATLSFLAPPVDSSGSTSKALETSIKLIGSAYNVLRKFLPESMAKKFPKHIISRTNQFY